MAHSCGIPCLVTRGQSVALHKLGRCTRCVRPLVEQYVGSERGMRVTPSTRCVRTFVRRVAHFLSLSLSPFLSFILSLFLSFILVSLHLLRIRAPPRVGELRRECGMRTFGTSRHAVTIFGKLVFARFCALVNTTDRKTSFSRKRSSRFQGIRIFFFSKIIIVFFVEFFIREYRHS